MTDPKRPGITDMEAFEREFSSDPEQVATVCREEVNNIFRRFNPLRDGGTISPPKEAETITTPFLISLQARHVLRVQKHPVAEAENTNPFSLTSISWEGIPSSPITSFRVLRQIFVSPEEPYTTMRTCSSFGWPTFFWRMITRPNDEYPHAKSWSVKETDPLIVHRVVMDLSAVFARFEVLTQSVFERLDSKTKNWLLGACDVTPYPDEADGASFRYG